MTTTSRALACGALAAAALGLSCVADAQSSAPAIGDAAPTRAGHSFIDVAVGRATYNTACGNVTGLSCSRTTTSYSVTAGNMITRNLGVELTYLDLGRANRAGGSVSAHGLNIAAVGRMPLGDSLALEAKAGTTYGVTHVNTAAVSGVASGRARGFGLGYGVALNANIAGGLHGALGWEQHELRFAGQGKSNVRAVTLGLGYTF